MSLRQGFIVATSTTNQEASLRDARLLLNVDEVAEVLAISRSTVFTLIKDGSIASFKIGGARRISWKSLEDFIERKERESRLSSSISSRLGS